MIKLEIEGKTYEVEEEVFRRVVVKAESNLSKLKTLEGSTFPKVDKDALKFAQTLMFNHRCISPGRTS